MNDNNNITITDIDIPFGKLVTFGIKWMLAMIPAVIVFYMVILFIVGIIGVAGFGLGNLF